MEPQRRPNFIHVLAAVFGALAGSAGGFTLAAHRYLSEPAPAFCPPCPECPVVVETPVPDGPPVAPTGQPSGMVQ